MSANSASVSWAVRLSDQAATEHLAQLIAGETRAGDLITLSGDLGAGKTTFARAFVRAFAQDPELEVPSPTFTLMQTYEAERGTVVHADLYRISDPEELDYMGWDEAIDNAAVLVEWPDKAGDYLSENRLDIHLRLVPGFDGERVAVLTGSGTRAARLTELKTVRTVLDRAGWGNAQRKPIYGDASSRLYERLTRPDGETAILMFSPPRPKVATYRSEKPYHVVARLSDSVNAFVAVDRGLRALGFSAPVIYGHDLEAGLLLVEDLGTDGFVDASGPIPERYAEAVRVLAKLHASNVPDVLPVAEGIEHEIPPYDAEALMVEVGLLLEWYLPHRAGRFVPNAGRDAFSQIWTGLLNHVTFPQLTSSQHASPQPTWALRDFHSPNLIWLKDRNGLARVGLIDFQDAVMSHPAYDLASLLQDARVTVSPELELKLLALYAQERHARDPAFDVKELTRAYAIMGAQRATKLLGLFVRLDKRDGKPAYLAHLPRIGEYLRRNLAHPDLSELRGWFEVHLPQLAMAEVERHF
ncbi:tRNA (adenosine(37)-N6)-threonylcarbamoyltransferase complex ATPase subunit type 1 TsaE [Pseudochelatococcus sp. G4_1912]|uniref:tRNA (adenosine(37)-N6)-threonylcarbamoyltransferase complex ATPase subunit type 1 TsaE n=1 Tax=Pseudochelatococcus sp. G4_1912 TaxID=3114288 RepID=UPI0039C63A12